MAFDNGDDIWILVKDAFSTGYFDPVLSETLMALIPKMDNPGNFKEFRQISLCNTIYKIITKVLVNQLRPILNKLIGPFQNSFLLRRGTTNNALALQEIMHDMHKSKKQKKKKKGDVVYKLYLEKAYDHVARPYLRSCLEDFGSPPPKDGHLSYALCNFFIIPSYSRQINWISEGVCNIIDRIARNFLWKDSRNKNELILWLGRI